MTTLNGNHGTESEKQNEKNDKAPFFRKLATASWLLPIIAVFWIKANRHASQSTDKEQAIVLLAVAIALVVGGLVCAILALLNVKKHGPIGIKKPALIGLLFSLLYLGTIGIGIYSGIARQQEKQKELFAQIKKESQSKVNELLAQMDKEKGLAKPDQAIVEISKLAEEIGSIYQKYLSEEELNWLGKIADKYNVSVDWELLDTKKMNALNEKIEMHASAEEKKTIARYNELIYQQIKK